MDAFRTYEARLSVNGKNHTLRFNEIAGSLVPAAPGETADRLAAWEFADEITGAKVSISMYGGVEERRVMPATSDPVMRLARLFLALGDLAAGVTLRGLDRLHSLRYADALDVHAVREILTVEERANLLAAALLEPFAPPLLADLPALAAVAGVDPLMNEADRENFLAGHYRKASAWSARVVGFKHQAHHFLREEAGVEKSKVRVGDDLCLVREHHNKIDPHAVAVIHPIGLRMGYLRRSISKRLAPAMDAGAVFKARVVAFLPDEYDLDERVLLRVERIA